MTINIARMNSRALETLLMDVLLECQARDHLRPMLKIVLGDVLHEIRLEEAIGTPGVSSILYDAHVNQ